MKPVNSEAAWCLEERQIFSQSLLWDIQRRYFIERSIEAWRQGEVPHYVTSNPTVANSYAEIVFAFLREHPHPQPCEEPLYLCELGAGSGRFAFHFLRQLAYLCEQSHVALTSFRYVITDFVERNLDFWRCHPRFQPFFDNGILDIAHLDVMHSDHLFLQQSGTKICVGSLTRPLVVIANYVWDGIPQELYYFDDRGCQQCLISLFVDTDRNPATLNAAELLAGLRVHYDYQPLTGLPFQDPSLQRLLDDYQQQLKGSRTHLLFPTASLRCLSRLQRLSISGLLVLSADKGDDSLSALENKAAPWLVRHGSFSLNVNYHAFKAYCEQEGGRSLFPTRYCQHLTIGCLLLLKNAPAYIETRRAYQRHIAESGPDDFYTISVSARQHIAEMTVAEMLAYTRLSSYDAHLFVHYLPRLQELALNMNAYERQEVVNTLDQVWERYFPLGEKHDLAYQMASLLAAIEDHQRAAIYFAHSAEIW
jgi:hypothetical protein